MRGTTHPLAMIAPPEIDRLQCILDAIAASGLVFRGGFHTDTAADAHLPKGTLLLIGSVGQAGWSEFSKSAEAQDQQPHPLDRWSQRLIDGLASQFGAAAFYPFGGPPYQPFQMWAQRAEPVFSSPLGLLIHPLYGLSHSYRGALLVPEKLALPASSSMPNPCESCADRPCLSACPASAFSAAGHQLERCTHHLASAGQTCMTVGCLARNACPVGLDFPQSRAQIQFHMQAFYKSRC
eukprot:gene13475-13590_t